MLKNKVIANIIEGGKQRSSNIELYRILVMLLIVAHHYVVNSGLLDVMNQNILSANTTFYSLFGAWGKTGINCFVLITGYFMCKSQITLNKFMKLLIWVITYSFTITTIFIVFGYKPEGILQMVLNAIPLRAIYPGDFTSCFILFYLCIPFLNILLKNTTKRKHQWLIVLLLFIYTVHGSVPKLMSVSMNYVSWFSVLYFIAAYLRLYPIKEHNTKFWGWATLISFGLSSVGILLLNYIQAKLGMEAKVQYSYMLVQDSNAFLALTNGITSFMWFKSMKIGYIKWINTIAASAFGVLLIHANSNTMRQWLWKDTVDCVGHFDTPYYWLYAIGCVLAIYALCTLIDYIRIKTIETPLLNATEKACYWVRDKFVKVER